MFSSCIFSHPARRSPSPAASFTTPARKAAWQARARRFEAFHEGGHEGAPIALSAAAAAIAALRARDWAAPPGDAPHPGVEAARLAACLIHSGHAAEARRLLRAAWPAGARGRAETERQLAARLACSPFAAAIRAVNPPGAPFSTARCQRNGPDQTAVHALHWR